MKHEFELEMFGCTQNESRAGINQLATMPTHGGAANAALTSILSDVQEMMNHGPTGREKARQYLNRVKDALIHSAPIELWGYDPENINVRADCMNKIDRAAREQGIDIYR
jgi:hypothetical protein